MIKEYLSKYKDDFNNCLKDLKNIKTWYKQIPNLLTISRPIGMIPANILFFTGNVVPAIILTGILLLTDLFDGKLARKWNVVSKFGADLDAVGDKVMFLGMALPLMVSNPIMIINILLEGIIAAINTYGRIKGLDTKTVLSGKIKTWLLSITLGIGYLVQFFNIPVLSLNLFVGATSILQLVAIKDYLVEYGKMSKEMQENKNDTEKVVVGENSLITVMEREKTLQPESIKTSLNELREVKSFLLSSQQPDKVYKGKKKVRIMLQEKNNQK